MSHSATEYAAVLQLTPTKFANLPNEVGPGIIAHVSDSTVTANGSVIAGGGTHSVLGWYNGVNWTVLGS